MVPRVERDGWGKIFSILVLLGIGTCALRAELDGGFIYSVRIDEVPRQPSERVFRVEGELQQGSLQFREEPCEWRFTLEGRGTELDVRFPECIVPDTLRDSFPLAVVVQGRMRAWGLEATEVIPRCPTKYEMGMCDEDPPHVLPDAPAEPVAIPQ